MSSIRCRAAALCAALGLALTGCGADVPATPGPTTSAAATSASPAPSTSRAAAAAQPARSQGPVSVSALLQWVPDDPSVTRSIRVRASVAVNGELATMTMPPNDRIPSKHAGPGQWLILDVPQAKLGDRVQVAAYADDALGEGRVACSLTVLNARTPLDRETSEAGDLPSVECDAVVTGP